MTRTRLHGQLVMVEFDFCCVFASGNSGVRGSLPVGGSCRNFVGLGCDMLQGVEYAGVK